MGGAGGAPRWVGGACGRSRRGQVSGRGGAVQAEADPAWAAANRCARRRPRRTCCRRCGATRSCAAPCRRTAGARRASRLGPPAPSHFARPGLLWQRPDPRRLLCVPPPQSAAANARGPKAAPSPGGLDDSTLPLVENSLGEYGARAHPEVQLCPSSRPGAAGRWAFLQEDGPHSSHPLPPGRSPWHQVGGGFAREQMLVTGYPEWLRPGLGPRHHLQPATHMLMPCRR